jgi:D-alanyl-lipoteichoic acid acyltransferase DltB (MBOAT superfamily)
MLDRSLGAGSIAGFWRHWNPIWSYSLGRFVLGPLGHVFPSWAALILTFAVSGVLHDLVIMAIRGEVAFLFTPWFSMMGIAVVGTDALGWNFKNLAWPVRAAINLTVILAGLALALVMASKLCLGF